MQTLTYFPSLFETYIINEKKSLKITKEILLIIAGSLLLALSAQISIPMSPVPFTMQTYAILLIGGIYGARLGFLTVLTYLIEGAMGFPVFANGSFGIGVIVGPTGGYLLGFLTASLIMGLCSNIGNDKEILKNLMFSFIAHLSIFFFGILWLASFVGFEKSIQLGFIPFAFSAVLKFVLASISIYGLAGFKKKL